MTSSTVVDLIHEAPSSQAIGVLFQRAHASYVDSTRYLIECGQLLREKRQSLDHGEWLPWLESNRDALGFGESTAQRLMKAANSNPALTQDLKPVDVLKLNRQIWGNSAKASREPSRATPPTPSQKTKPKENPNALHAADSPKAVDEHSAGAVQADDSADPEMPTAEEMADMDAAIDLEYTASVVKVMAANDKLAAANAEIKRQSAEIATLKVSRDGRMNERNAAIKQVLEERRECDRVKSGLGKVIDRLERKCADFERENEQLKADNEALRERVAIMEA